jgi:hypothetical protein
MKNLCLIIFIFLSCNSFAQQEKEAEIKKSLISETKTKPMASKQPTFMVNGEIKDFNQTVKLNLDLIKNIEIIKTDPKFPNGLVKITMKKE